MLKNSINLYKYYQASCEDLLLAWLLLIVVCKLHLGHLFGLTKTSLGCTRWIVREKYIDNLRVSFCKGSESPPDAGSIIYVEKLKMTLYATIWPLLVYFWATFHWKEAWLLEKHSILYCPWGFFQYLLSAHKLLLRV